MKKELISANTAKLAKKKGFNPFQIFSKLKDAIISNGENSWLDTRRIRTTSYFFYKEDNGVAKCYEMHTGTLSSEYGRFSSVIDNYFGKKTVSNYYYAFTQSLLQKLIWEKQQIWVSVELDYNHGHFDYKIQRKNVKGKWNTIKRSNYTGNFKDPYVVLDEGLFECLKII